jgi:hypothetical protein
VGGASCGFDTSPQILDGQPVTDRMNPGGATVPGTSGMQPEGSMPSGAAPQTPDPEPPKKDEEPLVPLTIDGLYCGGVACAFGTEPAKACCTTSDDVTNGSARAAQRCGLAFGASKDGFFGDACWQRDQGGVASGGCDGFEVSPGEQEAGCCSDQGRCGSMNTADSIGCHYALGEAPKTCGADDIDKQVECSPLGVFGARLEVDVSWGGRSGGLWDLTDDGRAPIVIDLMLTLAEIDGAMEVKGTARSCGVQLPPFYSTTLCESYKPIFPNEMWESAKLPSFPITGRYQCTNPGCFVTVDAITTLLGIDLDNPEALWPTPMETSGLTCAAGTGKACFPDHDGDNSPGLTIEMVTKGMAPAGIGCSGRYTYEGAPLSANPFAIFDGVRRTDRLSLGIRAKLGGSAKISADCNGGVGAAVAQYVQSRATGCRVQQGTFNLGEPAAGPNVACSKSEFGFLDENLPIYTVLAVGQAPGPTLDVKDKAMSNGARISITRLGDANDAVSCAEVRNAVYPRAP